MKDFFLDQGHLFAQVTLNYELPDYVRDADSQMEKAASLDDACFADPTSRLFPIHTRAHVFSSAIYANKQAGVDPKVIQAIEDRADSFGIRDDISKIAAYTTSLERKGEEKVASVVAPFVVEIGTPAIEKIAGAGPDAVQKAYDRFTFSVPEMQPDKITKAASALVEAFKGNGLSAEPSLMKFAGIGENDSSVIDEQKNLRLGLISDPVRKHAALSELKEIKTAESLLSFDRREGLDPFYGERLFHAHHVFHSGFDMQKVAATNELDSIKSSFLDGGEAFMAASAAFGPERADSMRKVGSLSITEDELNLLKQYLIK